MIVGALPEPALPADDAGGLAFEIRKVYFVDERAIAENPCRLGKVSALAGAGFEWLDFNDGPSGVQFFHQEVCLLGDKGFKHWRVVGLEVITVIFPQQGIGHRCGELADIFDGHQ